MPQISFTGWKWRWPLTKSTGDIMQVSLPAPNQSPWWVAPLAPFTAEQRRDWGRDWSWVTGGCFAFAEALHDVFGGELWGICSHIDADDGLGDDYPVEHALVKINGQFYDFNGVVDVDSYMARLGKGKKRQGLPVTLSVRPQTDPDVFWFEDEYVDDEGMDLLRKVLSGPIESPTVESLPSASLDSSLRNAYIPE